MRTGKGTVSLVFENKRLKYNIEKRHLMVIHAGVTFYIINRDDHEKLVLPMSISSIANPGDFVPFFTVGSEDPESFLLAYGSEVLETSYNTSNEQFHKIFSYQKKGVILKASKEQIIALTTEEGKEIDNSTTPFGPCQILSFLRESNECSKLFMVDYREYQKLEDLNMFISFSNLT